MKDTKDISSGFIDDIFPVRRIIIYSFFILLSCIYLPCAATLINALETPVLFSAMSFVLTIAGLVFVFAEVKKFGYTIITAAVTLFLYYLTGSFIIPAFLLSLVMVLSAGSYICSLCSKKTYFLLPLIPVVAYLGSYALTGNLIYSLVSLIPIPSIILQGILQKKNAARNTIILSSVTAIIAMCAGLAALLLHIYGKLSILGISETTASAREALIYFMKNLTVDMGDGKTMSFFATEYVDAFVAQIFNMLPSAVIVTFLVLVYICHSMQLRLYMRTDFDLMVTEKSSKITMSIYAACLFAISYILSLSTDTSGIPDLLGVITGNLRLILTPGLFIVGFDAVGAILKRRRGLGLILMLILIIAIFALPSYIILIMAAIGAVYIIVTAIDAWAKKHYSKMQ